MTVPNTTSAVSYTGTGSTAVYPYTWQIAQAADLVVYTLTAAGVLTNLALTTDYTVSGAGVPAGGTVTLVAGNLTSGTVLFIASDPLQVQLLLLQQGAAFNPGDVMNALDLLTRMVQALRRMAGNAIQVPLAESLLGLTLTLPTQTLRANKWLAFDSSGNPIPVTGSGPVLPSTFYYDVTAFGADKTGTSDSAPGIQAAINAASAAGGGIVYLPAGTYKVNSGITIPTQVQLVGAGGGWQSDLFPMSATAATVVVANASMTAVFSATASGAHCISDIGIKGIYVKCAGLAQYGIQLMSVCNGIFEQFAIEAPTVAGAYIGCVASLTNDPCDSQHNMFRNIMVRVLATATATGFVLTGNASAGANASFNVFSNVFIYHKNGPGFDIVNGDGNIFYAIRTLCQTGGTAYGMIFRESTNSSTIHARNNQVFGIQCAPLVGGGGGGMKFEGSLGFHVSKQNIVYGYSVGNGSPAPTMDAASECMVIDENGLTYTPPVVTSGTVITGQGVAARTLVTIDSSGGAVTFHGLQSGVAGQRVGFICIGANPVTFKNNSGSANPQKIFTRAGADLTITKGVLWLYCDGTNWYED